jgi:cytochrome b involved in lipid metabolism
MCYSLFNMCQRKKKRIKISRNECMQHCFVNDCWIIIDNKVYDVSKYIDNHSLHVQNIILNKARNGIDVSHDIKMHSKKEIQKLHEKHIGYITK